MYVPIEKLAVIIVTSNLREDRLKLVGGIIHVIFYRPCLKLVESIVPAIFCR